jgi:hypothetical protein
VITGHLGVAAAVRSVRRDASLLWLVAAALVPDVVDIMFALAGVCNPYGLYSHTIPVVVLLAAVLGGVAFLATGRPGIGLATALVVVLHLPLDFITGHKLFWPGGEMLGLGLYGWPLMDFLLEVPIALGGWWLLRRSGAGPRWATIGGAALVLVALQVGVDLPLDRSLKPSACDVAWEAGRQGAVDRNQLRDNGLFAVYLKDDAAPLALGAPNANHWTAPIVNL